MPAALNHSAISWLSAAAPEMKNRTRPPNRSRTLLNTSLSNSPCWSVEQERHRLAGALAAVDLEADLEGLVEDLLLQPALGLLHRDDPAVRLLEDARGGAHERRLHHAEVVDDLVDPAVDRGREAARELGGEQHLAERVRHRQPQELQVVLVEDVLDLDRGALVDPGPVRQPHALGAAGGAGGVDQGGELLGLDGRDRRLDGVGVLDEVLLAEVGERVEGDDPVAVDCWSPSKVTTLATVGSSAFACR